MADFCEQCAKELGFEVNDFEGLITEAQSKQNFVVAVLCEGCGHTYVNHKGECVWTLCPKHGAENTMKQLNKETS